MIKVVFIIGILLPINAVANWHLESGRLWSFIVDANMDGDLGLVDVMLWAEWLFFWPGDFVINISIQSALLGFLGFNKSDFSGVKSFFISLVLWFQFYRYLRYVLVEFSAQIWVALISLLRAPYGFSTYFILTLCRVHSGFILLFRIFSIAFLGVFLFFGFLALNLTQGLDSFKVDNELKTSFQDKSMDLLEVRDMSRLSDIVSEKKPEEFVEELVLKVEEKTMIMAQSSGIPDEILVANPPSEKSTSVDITHEQLTSVIVEEYMDKIGSHVQSRVSFPLKVDGNGATFQVLVTPSGIVLRTKLISTSGNQAYDEAVEKAIILAQPLPLPENERIYQTYFRLFQITVRQ